VNFYNDKQYLLFKDTIPFIFFSYSKP